MRLLDVRGLRVAYGGIAAVKQVDLHVDAGEMVCLIGGNGAGKTTTLKALAGLLPAAEGTIVYEGVEHGRSAPFQLVRRGLALVPEGRGIFGRLTVEENLLLGAYATRDAAVVDAGREHAFELFPRLAERRRQAAGTLSGGEQQMLAIARALMSRPKLLLLDEPSMGLAPIMVQRIFEIVRRIAVEGVTILLVEQNARLALEVSHRGYVMESGAITLADGSGALLANNDVQRSYLGG